MWQTILLEVGKGVLAGAGAKLFSSLFGQQKAPDYVGVILRAMEHMAQDLKRNLKLELERVEFEEAKAGLLAAQRKARQYNLSPKTRQDLLDEITVDLTDAVTNLEVLGTVSLPAYMLATALEVSIIQERAQKIGRQELVVAVCDTVPSAILHFRNMLAEMKAWNESRFTGITSRVFYDRRGEIAAVEYRYSFEGKTYTDVDQGELGSGAMSRLSAKRTQQMQRAWEEIRLGLEPVAETLRQMQQWAEESGVECPKGATETITQLTMSALDATVALDVD